MIAHGTMSLHKMPASQCLHRNFFTLKSGVGNVTTLHLESGLTGSLATINMADEGVAGNGKDSGCGGGRPLFLKPHFTLVYILENDPYEYLGH